MSANNLFEDAAPIAADSPYTCLADLINDDRFPELDSRLRQGEHIDIRHTHLFAMLRDGEIWLSEHYRRYGVELIQAPEDYWYLKPNLGSRNLIRSRKLDELQMVTGQVLAICHLDPEQLEDSGWITTDALLDRLRLLLEEEHLCRLLERKKINTQHDQQKAMDVLKRCLRQLARLGMIRLDGQQAERFQTQSPLMRFADPVRSAPLTREALERLVSTGFISLEADSEVADDDASAATEQTETKTTESAEESSTQENNP